MQINDTSLTRAKILVVKLLPPHLKQYTPWFAPLYRYFIIRNAANPGGSRSLSKNTSKFEARGSSSPVFPTILEMQLKKPQNNWMSKNTSSPLNRP